jgi:hypothetical protein
MDDDEETQATPDVTSIDTFNQQLLDDKIQDLMALLKLISKIQANEKICFASRQILPAHSLSTALRRIWDKESRISTLDRLNKLLITFREVDKNPNVTNSYKEQLLMDLETSLTGVFNLRTTYNDDRDFIAKLEVWIRNVNVILQEHKKK